VSVIDSFSFISNIYCIIKPVRRLNTVGTILAPVHLHLKSSPHIRIVFFTDWHMPTCIYE